VRGLFARVPFFFWFVCACAFFLGHLFVCGLFARVLLFFFCVWFVCAYVFFFGVISLCVYVGRYIVMSVSFGIKIL
jgi:hypothetical protein